MDKKQSLQATFLTNRDMVEAGMDIADEIFSDLIDPFEDVELTGAARERLDWARGELWERLGWLTGWIPQEGSDHYDDWLAELPRVLNECRYLRNVVRREVLLARGYDLPEEIKAPCHHQEEKDLAVVH